MGSDTLEKPGRQRTLLGNFQIYRDKVFDQFHRYKPRSLKPQVLVPYLAYCFISLVCFLASGSVQWFWAVISTVLARIRGRTNSQSPKDINTNSVSIANSAMDRFNDINWPHMGFKVISRLLLAVYAWMAIALVYYSPLGPGGSWPAHSVNVNPYLKPNIQSYFNTFEGAAVCDLKAADLYAPPLSTNGGYSYCNSRGNLLKALSEGGRHGFDTPYFPNGCHYRWFSVEEICAILDRFEGVVFIGDQNAEMIYAGFNILLRKDLQHGALRLETNHDKFASCSCNAQFADPSCQELLTHNTKEVLSSSAEAKSYHCNRTPHALLSIYQSPASSDVVSSFGAWVPRAPSSNYKSIPIIHSLTGDASTELATSSLDEFLKMADATKRKTPMLWIGPTAAGHVEIKGRKGNQEIWQFAGEMARIAKEKDVETLGLWNLTVQAESYDGKGYGEGVSIVAAMMVVNWLSRVEST